MRKLLFLFLWLCPLLAGAAHQPAAWGLFYKQSFAARNLYSSPLTVGGFRGDTYDYKVIIYARPVGSLAGILVRFNGDTGNNYRAYSLYASGSSPFAEYGNGVGPGWALATIVGANTTHPSAAVMDVAGKSGGERVARLVQSIYGTGAYVKSGNFWWMNTADELTSIDFYSTHNVAQNFDLIILQKLKLAQDAEWELVERKTLNSTNLSGGVFFSGLDGDRDEEYLLRTNVTLSGEGSLWAQLNGDTGNNYLYEVLQNNVGTAVGINNTTSLGFMIGGGGLNASQPLCATSRIKSKSGTYRLVHGEYGGGKAASNSNGVGAYWWLNTADKLERVRVYETTGATITATGYIELYRKGKSVSASKPTFEVLKEVDVDGEFSQGHTFDLAGLGIADADAETMLVLEYHGVSKTAGQTNMAMLTILNNDTGSNYFKQRLFAATTSLTSAAVTSTTMASFYTNSSYSTTTKIYIFPKSGKYIPALIEYGYYDGSSFVVGVDAVWWLNTADKLRSIKVYASSANQTQFKGRVTLKRLVAQ